MTKINGDIMGIYANGILVAHAQDSSLSVTMDIIDTTEKDSNKWTEHLRGNRGWEVSGNSLEVFASVMSVEQLIDFLINADSVGVQFKTNVGSDVFYSGQVSVTATSFAAPQNSPASFDFTFTGNSDLINSSTPVYSSDFSAGVDGWSFSRMTLSAPESIGGQDDALKCIANSDNNFHDARKALFSGSDFILDFDIYIPSSNSNIDGGRFLTSGVEQYNFFSDSGNAISLDTWVSISVPAFTSTSTSWRIAPADASVNSGLWTNDVFYIKNFIVRALG